jgi:phospholipid/cholesterol/gamma-HCH transport system substrate-binding protein
VLVMTRRENDPGEHFKLLVAGIGYLSLVVLLGALSTAIYLKVFDDVTTVTLRADSAGLQLAEHGDVRYNGVLVGQIRDITQQGESAVIELALEPESAKAIPRDVDASIMPTTLFGRKFVSLDAPAGKGRIGIPDGMVIPEDRVTTSVELGRVLNRLFPLLRSVRPGDLSATLNALATALSGRGEQIGETLEKLDSYLTTMNVHLPTLQEDLQLLASVAGTYDAAAPDLVRMLGNLTVTARTITSEKGEIAGLFSDVTELGNLGARILEDNEVNAVRAAKGAVPVLGLLEKYAPEYNCLLRGIARYKPILEKTFEGGEVKQYAEFPTTQRRAYDHRDRPEYADKRGPACYGMPENPWEPWPGVDMRNGTNLDSEEGAGESYFPAGAQPGPTFLQDLAESLTGQPVSYRGTTPQERRDAAAVLSAETGRSASTIPTLSTLMYAPMADGWRA